MIRSVAGAVFVLCMVVGSRAATAEPQQAHYTIHITTGSMHHAGTDANVSIILYGAKSQVGPWNLDDSKNNFEQGDQDEFYLSGPDIGDLQKIRLSHDNSGRYPGWFVMSVGVDKDKALTPAFSKGFEVERWLATDEPGQDDLQGNESLNHQTCFDMSYGSLPMPCNAPPTMRPPPVPSGSQDGKWFYFRMNNPNSSVTPCFTLMEFAPDEATAKALAEQQNGGYAATSIGYGEYIAGC